MTPLFRRGRRPADPTPTPSADDDAPASRSLGSDRSGPDPHRLVMVGDVPEGARISEDGKSWSAEVDHVEWDPAEDDADGPGRWRTPAFPDGTIETVEIGFSDWTTRTYRAGTQVHCRD